MTALVKRHLMPLTALAVFLAASLPFASDRPRHVVMGTVLLVAYWLVEWLGISGDFQDRVPRHPLVIASRALWLPGLVLCVLDALWLHWTPWQGPAVRIAGVVTYLVGLATRLWSMRALGGAFSYDLKVREGQELVTSGPYAFVRHPSYFGLLLWSVGIAMWNPSLPGLAILLLTTIPQIAYRIGVEEQLMRENFGQRWDIYRRRTRALVPFVW